MPIFSVDALPEKFQDAAKHTTKCAIEFALSYNRQKIGTPENPTEFLIQPKFLQLLKEGINTEMAKTVKYHGGSLKNPLSAAKNKEELGQSLDNIARSALKQCEGIDPHFDLVYTS